MELVAGTSMQASSSLAKTAVTTLTSEFCYDVEVFRYWMCN
jgi:hypothetical protein